MHNIVRHEGLVLRVRKACGRSDRVKRGRGELLPPPDVGFLGTDLGLFERGNGLFKLSNGIGDGVEQGEILGHGNTSFLQAG